jgi:hypothetical protein
LTLFSNKGWQGGERSGARLDLADNQYNHLAKLPEPSLPWLLVFTILLYMPTPTRLRPGKSFLYKHCIGVLSTVLS